MKTTTLALASAMALGLGGCALGEGDTVVNGPPPGSGPNEETPQVTAPPVMEEQPQARCDMGKTYLGIGGRTLTAGRVDADQNVDRARMKPYSAMAGEFERVLGKSPSLLSQMGQVFGSAPARWDREPQASAISLYTAYRVGFVGCLDFTSSGEAFASHPSLGTAEETCREWGRTFWSRELDGAEVESCVQVAVGDSAKETNPRRRWAYACASLLSSAGFLSY